MTTSVILTTSIVSLHYKSSLLSILATAFSLTSIASVITFSFISLSGSFLESFQTTMLPCAVQSTVPILYLPGELPASPAIEGYVKTSTFCQVVRRVMGGSTGSSFFDPDTVNVDQLTDREIREVMEAVKGYDLINIVGGGGLDDEDLKMETQIVIDKEKLYSTFRDVYNSSSVSVSFNGCSWMIYYHLGVASYLLDTFTKDELKTWKFAGSSCGSLVAFGLAHGVDFSAFRQFAQGMITYAHVDKIFGPTGRMTKIVEDGVRKFLAAGTIYDSDSDFEASSNENVIAIIDVDDTTCNNSSSTLCHTTRNSLRSHPKLTSAEKLKDRLFVSVTILKEFFEVENEIISDFGNDDETLINILMSSCYIPVYYEKIRFINNSVALDGGLSNNQPLVDPHTIAVAPINWGNNQQLQDVKKEEHNDNNKNVLPTDFNIKINANIHPPTSRQRYPARMSLFPGNKEDTDVLFRDGYRDARSYFEKHFGIDKKIED